MEIEVINSPKKALTDNIVLAANFFGRKLLHGNLLRNIDLTIMLEKEFDCAGLCTWVGNWKKPRDFLITLRTKKYPGESPLLQTLAHEMVHLSQYASGTLIDHLPDGQKVAYQGNLYKKIDPESSDEYWDAPWEIEAYGREVGLYRRWLEFSEESS